MQKKEGQITDPYTCIHKPPILDSILNSLPQNELIMGVDINANICLLDNMSPPEFGPVLGHHELPMQNSKVELVTIYLAHHL